MVRCMRHLIFCILISLIPVCAQAQTFYEVSSSNTDQLQISGQTREKDLTYLERENLHKRLKTAVFMAYSYQPKKHPLMQNGLVFDGAVVAVKSECILDIIPKDDVTELPAEEAKPHNPSSFFDQDLHYVSSPFQKKPESKNQFQTGKQYYLTTADWLTNSTKFEIVIQNHKIPAKLEYRDDSQNVALLSTQKYPSNQVEGVSIYSSEDRIPSHVFVLLSPESRYESFTQHELTVSQEHLYGNINLVVRNGYPVFYLDGSLVGLIVGPEKSNTSARIVHPALLDRAIHPAKYDRSQTETIDLIEYGGNHAASP